MRIRMNDETSSTTSIPTVVELASTEAPASVIFTASPYYYDFSSSDIKKASTSILSKYVTINNNKLIFKKNCTIYIFMSTGRSNTSNKYNEVYTDTPASGYSYASWTDIIKNDEIIYTQYYDYAFVTSSTTTAQQKQHGGYNSNIFTFNMNENDTLSICGHGGHPYSGSTYCTNLHVWSIIVLE